MRLELGAVYVTAAVHAWLADDATAERGETLSWCLARHAAGEDGAIHPDDRPVNAHARTHGGRVLTIWPVAGLSDPLWIITEADRSSTTVLLPNDY